jgi:hypothetical protein
MRIGAMNLALGNGELDLGHAAIIPAWKRENESQNQKQKSQQVLAERSRQ